MARPIWSGTISFGLVTVPVGLYSATEDHNVHFHQLERGTDDRIRYRRVNERTGEEVDRADIVKGREVNDGYVVVDQEELDEIAPGRSRSIEIETFVSMSEIDPIYFNRAYWLAPTNADYGHAYHLLVRAMAETDRVGIAEFVMRGRQYLTAVHADNGLLALHTLYFADEIRDPAKEIPKLPKAGKSRETELAMAVDLIGTMSGPWQPADYHNTYQEQVRKLIADKRAGREITVADEPAEPTKVLDLTEALRRSMEKRSAEKSGPEKSTTAKGSTAKRARKSDTKSTPAARKSDTKSGKDDLADASKADLLRLARELDVAGRSGMSRDELAKAVRQARTGARRAKKKAS
jgi:DNA end-binding protein Ku